MTTVTMVDPELVGQAAGACTPACRNHDEHEAAFWAADLDDVNNPTAGCYQCRYHRALESAAGKLAAFASRAPKNQDAVVLERDGTRLRVLILDRRYGGVRYDGSVDGALGAEVAFSAALAWRGSEFLADDAERRVRGQGDDTALLFVPALPVSGGGRGPDLATTAGLVAVAGTHDRTVLASCAALLRASRHAAWPGVLRVAAADDGVWPSATGGDDLGTEQ